MREDDLGYLLRRSNDERKLATEAEDSGARLAHDQMANHYAEQASKLLTDVKEAIV